jgi:AraC-like DNA-binding protein
VFGIRFKPEGIPQLFGVPAAKIQSGFADMECITGKKFKEYTSRLREATNIRDRLALSESYLFSNISNCDLNLYYLNRAAEIIRRRKGLISVEELAGSVYISSRQLEREFKEKIGISPKSYMRIARLNEVNRIILNGDKLPLSRVSYDCGYSDQAHFIRDFRKFTGERPAVLIREKDNFIINPNLADSTYL